MYQLVYTRVLVEKNGNLMFFSLLCSVQGKFLENELGMGRFLELHN
jgi:hypothetical protein